MNRRELFRLSGLGMAAAISGRFAPIAWVEPPKITMSISDIFKEALRKHSGELFESLQRNNALLAMLMKSDTAIGGARLP